MCQACIDAVREHLPKITEGDIGELLMGATCWPAGDKEMVAQQIRSLAAATDGSLAACLDYADSQLDIQFDAMHAMDALFGEEPAVPA